jgi:hypothetical protein
MNTRAGRSYLNRQKAGQKDRKRHRQSDKIRRRVTGVGKGETQAGKQNGTVAE